MNLKDLSRIIRECGDDVDVVNQLILVTLPQAKTRLTESLVVCKDVLTEEQKKEIKLAIDLIDNSIQFKTDYEKPTEVPE